MTDPSLGRKKRKITITASLKGVELAEKALIRLGFDSKANFAESQRLARNTVTKFFQGEPIQLDSFKRICEALKLNWRTIAGLTEEKQPKQLSATSHSIHDSDGMLEQVQLQHRQVTVTDRQSKKIKAVITLQGDIDSVQNWKIIQYTVQEYSGDSIEITDIKEGSIRLFVEGSPEDIKQLVSRIESGQLRIVAGFPVEDVQIVSESSNDDESIESDKKWLLIQKIFNPELRTKNLFDADLSDVDLSGANFRGAYLSDADLSGADLSGANLSRANLSHANLSGADLSNADLSNANLTYANLSDTYLRRANLINAKLFYANLSSANLSDADLSGADLSGANLSNADLSNTNLSDINLRGININEQTQIDDKWRLVWEIVNQGAEGRDLSNADLMGAKLSGANLSGANLSSANLSSADLRNANLSGADLSYADLSYAELRNANLSGASLNNANVVDVLFGRNRGLTEDMKRDLVRRGARFGDRPPVPSPR
jgi:uncharacterized protein YjbI with pentapeptide repeats